MHYKCIFTKINRKFLLPKGYIAQWFHFLQTCHGLSVIAWRGETLAYKNSATEGGENRAAARLAGAVASRKTGPAVARSQISGYSSDSLSGFKRKIRRRPSRWDSTTNRPGGANYRPRKGTCGRCKAGMWSPRFPTIPQPHQAVAHRGNISRVARWHVGRRPGSRRSLAPSLRT